MHIFTGFNFTYLDDKDALVDVEQRKVFLRLNGQADTKIGHYESEFFFILKMDEDGKNLEEIVEVLDTETIINILRHYQEQYPLD
ncbi:hypothetical protein MPH_13271, partial [Macrophomina phaseolina MS6]